MYSHKWCSRAHTLGVLIDVCRWHKRIERVRQKIGEGKGDTKGETVREEKSVYRRRKAGLPCLPLGFPLRRESKLVTFITLGSTLERQAIMAWGKRVLHGARGSPLLQGMPLFKNSPPDYFWIHPMRSARCKGLSLSAESDKGAALDPPPFFTRKRWTKKPVYKLVLKVWIEQ